MERFMRFWKFLAPLLASTLSFAATSSATQADRIAGPIDSSQMVALPNHVSPLAQVRYVQGPIDPARRLNVTMMFVHTAAQQSALQQLLAEQQDPKSGNFHKWLTPEQYADSFGLSQNDIAKISAWVESQGLSLVHVARGRDSLTFSGDAAQVQTVLKTQINNYNLSGKIHFANSSPPMIPAALSGIVGGFRGLHNFFPQPQLKRHPDYTFTVGSNSYTAIAPGDIAVLYDLNPLYQGTPVIDGTGQKLVLVGQTDIYLADINDYRGDFGLSTIPSSSSSCAPSTEAGEVGVITAPCDTTNFQYVVSVQGGDPGLSPGDISESDLDIEVSGSVARNAQLIFVTSGLGVGDSWSYAIDNDLAPIISISYGLCEALAAPPNVAVQDEEFQKAASLGISVFAAAGDGGAATCDGLFGDSTAIYGLSVSYPASSPEVTGMGGTEFDEGNGTYWGSTATNSETNFGVSALSYIPELAWNDTTFLLSQGDTPGATGGGPSNCVNFSGFTSVEIQGFEYEFSDCDAPTAGGFAKPSYQTALTPSDSVRDVPDLSFSASNVNDPYIVCTPQSELSSSTSSTSSCVNGITTALATYNSAFGGTSASTPLAAGMTALLNQYLGANGLGTLNTQLYKLYGTNPTAFHDINTGVSTIGDNDSSDNIVPCTSGDPTFEPIALRCPSTDSFGYSVVGGHSYSSVTGLGSLDIDALFQVWAASRTASSVTISASGPTTINQGTSVTFTATISPLTAAGTVSFSTSNNSVTTVLGTAVLNNPTTLPTGTATFATTALPGGTNNVTATFQGDASYNASTSAATTITVTAPFTVTPGPSSLSVAAGQTATYTITVAPVGGFNQTVNFSSATSPVGGCTAGVPAGAVCSFSPNNVTLDGIHSSTVTLTIATAANMALPSGAQAITVTGTSGTTVVTANVNLTVTATNQSFTLTTTAATFIVSAVGGSVPVTITVANPGGGGGSPIPFVGGTTALPLTYTCAGTPSLATSEISCQISPGNGQPTSATSVTATFVTTAKTTQLMPLGGKRIFYALLLPGLFGIFFLSGPRTRGIRLLSLMVVLGCSTLWLGACGGGGSSSTPPNNGTPTGTYAVTITASTSVPTGGTALTFTLPLTLNVQ
jgi:subtilase family serine protease